MAEVCHLERSRAAAQSKDLFSDPAPGARSFAALRMTRGDEGCGLPHRTLPSRLRCASRDTSSFRGGRAALVRNDTKGRGGPPRASAPTGSRFTVPSSLFPVLSSLFPLLSSLFTLHSSLNQKRPAPVYEAERSFYAFVRPSPKLTARALSTALMALSSRWPIRSRRRDLSRVRICSSRITLSRFRPTLGPER